MKALKRPLITMMNFVVSLIYLVIQEVLEMPFIIVTHHGGYNSIPKITKISQICSLVDHILIFK